MAAATDSVMRDLNIQANRERGTTPSQNQVKVVWKWRLRVADVRVSLPMHPLHGIHW